MTSRPVRLYLFLVAFSLAGSLASRLTGSDPTPIARPVALFTLIVGCWASFGPVIGRLGWRGAAALSALLAIGAASEFTGLATGLPFGNYRYTANWWPTLWFSSIGYFPLQLPFAWALVVGSAYLYLAPRIRAATFASAALAMVIDQVMEPTMVNSLRYWRWLDTGPLMAGTPILNAVGWFGVSLIGALAMRLLLGDRVSVPAADPGIVLLAYLVLVIGIGLIR